MYQALWKEDELDPERELAFLFCTTAGSAKLGPVVILLFLGSGFVSSMGNKSVFH